MGHDTTFTECIKQHYFGMVFNQWLAPASIKQNPAFMPEAVPLITFIPQVAVTDGREYGKSNLVKFVEWKKKKPILVWLKCQLFERFQLFGEQKRIQRFNHFEVFTVHCTT